MRHQRGKWKETAIEKYEIAQAQSAMKDYAHVVHALEDWAHWCQRGIGPTGYVSMMGRVQDLGLDAYAAMRGAARGPEPDDPHAEMMTNAVQALPAAEKDAIQLKYLGVVRCGQQIVRKHNTTDTDCARIFRMDRKAWYALLGRAYAHINGWMSATTT